MLSPNFREEQRCHDLVGSVVAASALNGRLLEEPEVEVNTALHQCAILDESVDVNIVQSHFTEDGWLAVIGTASMKRFGHQWYCETCHSDLGEFPSIFVTGALPGSISRVSLERGISLHLV